MKFLKDGNFMIRKYDYYMTIYGNTDKQERRYNLTRVAKTMINQLKLNKTDRLNPRASGHKGTGAKLAES